MEPRNYSTILHYYVVPYVGHAVPRYNGAFPKWREGRASGCWFLVCPETGELQLGASRYKKDKGEEDDSKKDKVEEREGRLRKSHVTRVYSNAAYYMLLL